MPNIAVIIVAAGKGSRFEASRAADNAPAATSPMDGTLAKKPFVPLAGKPVFLHSIERFAEIEEVKQQILVVAPEDFSTVEKEFAEALSHYQVTLVRGGKERCDSVENGLAALGPVIDYIAVHDAARPCVTKKIINAVYAEAMLSGAAIPATRLVGTIKKSRKIQPPKALPWQIFIDDTVPREELWEAQTPQIFASRLFLRAFRERGDFSPTDDASLIERLGKPVLLVKSDRTNLKITTAADLELAELILAARK